MFTWINSTLIVISKIVKFIYFCRSGFENSENCFDEIRKSKIKLFLDGSHHPINHEPINHWFVVLFERVYLTVRSKKYSIKPWMEFMAPNRNSMLWQQHTSRRKPMKAAGFLNCAHWMACSVWFSPIPGWPLPVLKVTFIQYQGDHTPTLMVRGWKQLAAFNFHSSPSN